MSVFSGTFVDASGRGEHVTGLAGSGTIRIEPGLLVLTGQRPRATLAGLVAGCVAFVLLVVVVSAIMLGGFSGRHVTFIDLKLVVVVGVAVAVGAFLGLRALLLRVLPLQSVEIAIGLHFVVFARVNSGALELLTTSPDLAGLSAFQGTEAVRFVEELEIARRGTVKGYR